MIGGGWPASEIDGRPRLTVERPSLAANAAVATEVMPALREVNVTRSWAGMTSTVGRKNRVGLLGRATRLGHFYVVVASGLGFTLGPVLGRLTAELRGRRQHEFADRDVRPGAGVDGPLAAPSTAGPSLRGTYWHTSMGDDQREG